MIDQDLRQTLEHARFLTSLGWIVKKDPQTKALVFVKTIPFLRLSVMKIQRPRLLPTKKFLEKLIFDHSIFQAHIEPHDDRQISTLVKYGYRRSLGCFIPSATSLIDLRLTVDHLTALMKPKARYNISLSRKKGVETTIYTGKQLLSNSVLFDQLYEIQSLNAQRLGIYLLPKSWFWKQIRAFGDSCFCVMASKESVVIAVAFYVTSSTGVYYSHNGSTLLGRRFFAPTLCVWEGILEGKRRGLDWFDFEGVYDPRSNMKKWIGFTRFKESFGGKTVLTPGLYSRLYWPFKKEARV